LLYIGFGGLLLFALFSTSQIKTKIINHLAPLLMIGRHSYSIYLWHIAVFVFVMKGIPAFGSGKITLEKLLVLYSVGSIIIGIGMSKLVEQPVLRIRNKIFPSRCGNLPDQHPLRDFRNP
jgi:peptidoglycan/LPS O-acetylase OafA/YrhL